MGGRLYKSLRGDALRTEKEKGGGKPQQRCEGSVEWVSWKNALSRAILPRVGGGLKRGDWEDREMSSEKTHGPTKVGGKGWTLARKKKAVRRTILLKPGRR